MHLIVGTPATVVAPGRRRAPVIPVSRQAILWVAPLLVALAMTVLSQRRIQELIAGALGLLLLIWAVRHPGPSLSILAVIVALQQVAFGFLYAAHVPVFALRSGGALKDLLGIAVLIAAAAALRRNGGRLGRAEKFALVYVGVVTCYLLLPGLFAPGSPHQWNARLISWRLDAGYPLLFIAVRHAPLSRRAKNWFLGVVIGIGTLAAGFAVWQYMSPGGFYNFIVNTGKQAAYETNVLHSSQATVTTNLSYLTKSASRVHLGSIFISPFDMADYLVIVFAIVVERLVRRPGEYLLMIAIGLVGFALFASQVRANAVAAIVVLLASLVPAAGRSTLARWRMVLAVGIAAAVLVPSLTGTRYVGGHNGGVSTTGHINETTHGVDRLIQFPLGQGLGTNPLSVNRFQAQGQGGAYTSDNSYLQVGDELGILALIPWLIFVAGALTALVRRARAPSYLAASAALALIGVLVTGFFHHVFLDFSGSWTVWALAGVGLNHSSETGPPREPGASPRDFAGPPALLDA